MNNYTTTSTNDYLPESLRLKIKEELTNAVDKILDKLVRIDLVSTKPNQNHYEISKMR
jgi:hypothetical protein